MSGGARCECKTPLWVVTAYRKNYSAFNGYQMTRSRYSEVTCRTCGVRWRTKAGYVESLPIDEDFVWSPPGPTQP